MNTKERETNQDALTGSIKMSGTAIIHGPTYRKDKAISHTPQMTAAWQPPC